MGARTPLALVALVAAACRAPADDPYATWAAGDALWQQEPRFVGGDAAYSVALSPQRTLWLFGDTFVGPRTGPDRSGLPMTRNAVAIQSGDDPRTASMAYAVDEGPFFGTAGDAWLWPGPGVRVGDTLAIGLAEIHAEPGGLGFATAGSKVAFIDNPDADPDAWVPRIVDLPTQPAGAQLALGAWLHEGDSTLLFAPVEPGSHDVMLARWSDAELERGDVAGVEWFDGQRWGAEPGAAAVVVEAVQTEFSVHREPDGVLWLVSVDGFGGTNVVVRRATDPVGPWSKPQRLLRPAESSRPGVLVYSAKVHPQLRAPGIDGPLLTYCVNHTDFPTLVGDMSLYFPRFAAPATADGAAPR